MSDRYYSEIHELSVLGALTMRPDLIEAVLPILRPGDFYRPFHGAVYNVMLRLSALGVNIDPVELVEALTHDSVVMKNTGGSPGAFVMTCREQVFSTDLGDVSAKALKIRELSHARDSHTAAIKLQQAYEGGDEGIIESAFNELQKLREEAMVDTSAERFPSVNWDDAFSQDFSEIDWLPGQFMERGQQVALVGSGKVGKSLFTLDWIVSCVTGQQFLGHRLPRTFKILYFDRENSLRDIVTRAQALGANADDLRNGLVYKMFPSFSGTLDASAQAARELLAIVDEEKPDVVVLDTVSRFIEGDESSANTWLQLYQLIHAPLKARGVACLRLDHFGKDEERGSRGSSAKSQDVDHVWELSIVGAPKVEHTGGTEEIITVLKMKRSYTRTGLGEDAFAVTRRGVKQKGGGWLKGRTMHALTEGGPGVLKTTEFESAVDMLMRAGAPKEFKDRNALREFVQKKGLRDVPTGNTVIGKVLEAYRERVTRQYPLGEGF